MAECERGNGATVILVLLLLAALLSSHRQPANALANRAGSTIDMRVRGMYDAGSSFYHASVTAADLDGDGRQELLVGNTNGKLYCFNSRARVLWVRKTGGSIQGAPACYDVDGDGRKEVWVGDLSGAVWGLNHKGEVLNRWGWPKQTPPVGGIGGVFSSPAVGDITGDGSPEIVVGTFGQQVYAWNYKGDLVPGWPYNNEDTIWSSPALADLDWDGLKEIVIGADSTGGVNWPYPPGGLLYAFNGDGTVLPGFPRVTPEVTWSSPAVADIDRDGRYEIIVGTGHYYKATGKLTTEGHRVYAYNHDGSDVKGWPARTAGSTFSSPAVGDINGDGSMEVVIATNAANGIGADHITVMRADGTRLLDRSGFGSPMMGSPALGDINGDGLPDIILGTGHQMCAWDHKGNVLWNQNMGNFVVGSPAVGDFEGEGRVLVAVATGDAPGGSFPGGRFYVFDCGPKSPASPENRTALFPWPMFRRDRKHHATVLTGREPDPPAVVPRRTWYLAEGSTGPGMETWVLVQNPNDYAVDVFLTFMTNGGYVKGPAVRMPGRSRYTLNVSEVVPDTWEVSTRVKGNAPIIVERAMYGDGRRWAHESVGSPATRKTWYLAEGSTGPGMETWVLVQNPNRSEAGVKLTYMTEKGPVNGPSVVMPPLSRKTFNPADTVPGRWEVSTKVTADEPVVAERAMYGAGRAWAHGSVGVSVPSANWYLAEGSTGPGMETWVLVQNPTYPEARVTLTFMTPNGPVEGPSAVIPSCTRRTFNLADSVPDTWEVSTRVVSDRPVIVERSMYGAGRTWAQESVGATVPRKTWYLAEGSTGPGMETWVLVQNPNRSRATATLTYMTPGGPVKGPTVPLYGRSRRTFHVADTVPASWQVSTVVTSDRPVVVERTMFGDNRAWAHGSVGYAP